MLQASSDRIMDMKNDKTATPETAALPQFPWMTNLPDALAWSLGMQDILWRETLLTMARMAELRAECLRHMAHPTMPMDAAAIQGDYARKLLNVAEEEGSRIARAMKGAAPATRTAA
jgi:hypothetical protein